MERQTYSVEQVARIVGQSHQTVRRNLEPYRSFTGKSRTVITIASVYAHLTQQGQELPQAAELEMPAVLRLSQIANLLGVGDETAEAMIINAGLSLTTIHRTKVLTYQDVVELLGDKPRAWSALPALREVRQPYSTTAHGLEQKVTELEVELAEVKEYLQLLDNTLTTRLSKLEQQLFPQAAVFKRM